MRLRPYGDRGLLVELPSRAQRRALLAALGDRAGLEVVSGEQTVLALTADAVARRNLADALGDLDLTHAPPPEATGEHRIPTRYDGPDLHAVAQSWGCSPDAVADRHAQIEWLVEFVGFTAGFGYLVTDHELPSMPRRDSPRSRVPAGSVALAAHYCGVYPRSTPGGWQLIGRTDVVLFDPLRRRPALLRAGDRVRFEPVR